MENHYKFEVQGYLQEYSYEDSKNDLNSNGEFHFEKLVHYFRDHSEEIEYEISKRIAKSLYPKIGEELRIDVHLRYEIGSFEWYGFIEIIDWAGRAITGATILIYIEKLIRISINRVISRYLGRVVTAQRWQVVSEVITVPSLQKIAHQTSMETSNNKIDPSIQLFPLRTILIGITLLNVILFVGGSVYNSFSISSIQDKHKEAMEIIHKSKENYEKSLSDANQMKSTVSAKIDEYLDELESSNKSRANSMLVNTEKKLDKIAKNLSGREKTVLGEINALSGRVTASSSSFSETEKEVNSYVGRLKHIVSKLESYEKADIVIGFDNFWDYTDWFFRVYIIGGVLIILASIISLLLYIKNR